MIKNRNKYYVNDTADNRPGLVLTRLEASAVLEKYRVELLEKLCWDWPSAIDRADTLLL